MLDIMYPGTPPAPASTAYDNQVGQIKKIIGVAATNKAEAYQAAVMIFIPDMSYHRGAISQSLEELGRERET